MSEINLEPEDAMRQAWMTAEHYLNSAYKVLKDNDYEDWSVRDAIELAKIMSQDFHTAMTCMKMQEIRDAINLLTEEVSGK